MLAAGLGTRLRPLTRVRAKPASPVAGEPLIRRIITWLVESGVPNIVINLHHRPETLAAVVGDGSDLGAHVRYSWEQPTILGSAGGPRQALPLIDAGTFLIVNGDTLADVDLSALAAAHRAGGALITLAVVPNVEPERYGGVALGPKGIVTGFARRGKTAVGTWHFVGVQIAAAEVFAPLPAGLAASSVGGGYDELAARKPGAIRGFTSDARFFDVGTPADYWRTTAAFAAGAEFNAGRGVRIAPGAHVERSILWDDVRVDEGCRVEECIATDGVRIRAGSAYRRVILRRDDGGELEPGERRERGLAVMDLDIG